jgi:HAMP domain-containing protein
MRIRTKVVLGVFAGMAAVAIAGGAVMRAASERNIRLNAEAAVASGGAAFLATERADVAKLSATLTALLADPRFRAPFERRDRAALAALAEPIYRELRLHHGVTHWYFHLPDRTCFLRVHKPGQAGDRVERATLARASASGGLAAGKELGKTAFALRVVSPWIVDGKTLGYVELGEEIDGFLQRMKQQTGDDYALLVEKRHLDHAGYADLRRGAGERDDWNDHPTLVRVDATSPGAVITGWEGDVGALPAAGAFLGESVDAGRTFARGALPVIDASGARVGALVVRTDITKMHDNMTGARARVLALLVAAAVLCALLLVWLVNSLVFDRLRQMTSSLEDVSARLVGGDYAVGGALPAPTAEDEIGGFEAFFGRFIAVVAETLQALEGRRK